MTDILNLNGKDLDKELSRIIATAPQRRKFWTEKEDVVLKRLYEAGISWHEIAKRMGRTYNSVQERATRKWPQKS